MLENKVALVTGASRGIGAAIARALGAQKAKVAVNFRSGMDRAEEVARSIAASGGEATIVGADVTDPGQVEAMVALVEKTLGPIDILVNNASITFPYLPFLQYDWDAFEAKIVNEAKASFYTCQAVAAKMVERGGGSIVNVSSELSRSPGPGFVAHSSAKSALDAFSKSLALELGPHGVRVNVVAPGFTRTEATAEMPEQMVQGILAAMPLGRVGAPEDVANAVLFFCSEAARHVTGTYLPVCGGSYLA